MPNDRQQLLNLIARQAFTLGEFKLSSGGTSDYYVDCRRVTLDAEGVRLTGTTFLNEIRAREWHPEAVGGLTLGADPIVVAVAMLSAQQAMRRDSGGPAPVDRPQPIHGFLVRKAEKAHGTRQRIEGFCRPGARVVIVDDVCTTGNSTVQGIEAARAAGMQVVGVICLVERAEAGGRAAVEPAAAPAPFISLFTAADIRQEHLRLKAATPEVFAVSGKCDMCDRPAVTNMPASRCEVHRLA